MVKLGVPEMAGAKRELIDTGTDKRYVRRDEKGRFKDVVDLFLTHLGLSIDAIRFITAAPPQEVRWLALDDARRLGIAIAGSMSLRDAQRFGSHEMTQQQTAKPKERSLSAARNSDTPAWLDIALIKTDAYRLAHGVSQLVAALGCGKNIVRVDEERIRAAHKALSDEGITKYGEHDFMTAVADELGERRDEILGEMACRASASSRGTG
jgi:hypothetical protein